MSDAFTRIVTPQRTVVPKDEPGKAVYLYHPVQAGSRRVDLTKDDAQATLSALHMEGWTEKRFAQMFYHKRNGTQVVTDPSKVKGLLKNGWSDTMFTPASEEDAKNYHPDTIHPHWNDTHRQNYLLDQATQPA